MWTARPGGGGEGADGQKSASPLPIRKTCDLSRLFDSVVTGKSSRRPMCLQGIEDIPKNRLDHSIPIRHLPHIARRENCSPIRAIASWSASSFRLPSPPIHSAPYRRSALQRRLGMRRSYPVARESLNLIFCRRQASVSNFVFCTYLRNRLPEPCRLTSFQSIHLPLTFSQRIRIGRPELCVDIYVPRFVYRITP